MFECARRGTLCDATCADCPRRLFKPKSEEEYEEDLVSLTENLGFEVPRNLLSLAAAELAKEHDRSYGDLIRMLGLPDTTSCIADIGSIAFNANRNEALCTHCGHVDCAAHIGLCATCAAFIDFGPDVGTEP